MDEFAANREKMAAYQRNFQRYNRVRKAFLRNWLRFYHRLEVIGIDRLPAGPALIAANHGGGFDLDIMTLSDCCHPTRPIQTLIDYNWHYHRHWWGRYFIGSGIPLWTTGGIRWDYLDPYLKPGGESFPGLVAIFPEGHSGAFRRRRVLSPFFPGVVRIALRYRLPIVPAAMVGFHSAAPILYEIQRDHGPNDIVFLPFTFPVKLKVEFGEPFELTEYYGQELPREEEFRVANDLVRPRLAALLAKHQPVDVVPAGQLKTLSK